MKSCVTIILIVFAVTFSLDAQWFVQSSGTVQNLNSVSFANSTTGWACGANGQIIKTTDGFNWSPQTSGTYNNLKNIQFIDSDNGWAFGSNQLLRTTNGGTNWSVLNFSSPIDAFHFVSGNVGWLTANGGIYKTTDGGLTWTSQNAVNIGYLESIFSINENYGWATNMIALIKTTDGGNNWVPYPRVFFTGSPMCLKFVNTLTGWFSHNTLGSYVVSKTTDSGVTWFDQIAESFKYIECIDFLNSSTGYAAGYTMSGPTTPEKGIIKKTTDGGTTWIEPYNEVGGLSSIFMVNELIGWAVGKDGKILKTVNGGLPVELVGFTANVNKNIVNLNWSTTTETNNKGFQV
ncbi:MAG: hypothetical protein K8H86_06105, partial [Ignavibacteriaceae bacterium]|nr:hypothetical protein [Ignavibacteriaceae bacterium]